LAIHQGNTRGHRAQSTPWAKERQKEISRRHEVYIASSAERTLARGHGLAKHPKAPERQPKGLEVLPKCSRNLSLYDACKWLVVELPNDETQGLGDHENQLVQASGTTVTHEATRSNLQRQNEVQWQGNTPS